MAVKKRVKPAAKRKRTNSVLRKKAEERLTSHPEQTPAISTNKKSPVQLLHELQVYQVELEMQNDELRRSQQALEEEKSRFAAIFNFAPVGFLVLDTVAVIQDCNEMALRLLSAGKKEVLGKRFHTFVSPEGGDQFYFFLKKLIDSGETRLTQLPFIDSFGKKFVGQLQGNMVRDAENSHMLYYVTLVEITEKHLAELKLQHTSQRLQIALKTSLSGILSIDLKTGVVFADDFVLGLFELSDKKFDGSLAALYKPIFPEDVERIEPAVRAALSGAGNLHEIFRVGKRTEEIRYVEIHGKAVSVESENDIFIGLLSDITAKENQRIQAEHAKQAQQGEMLRTILKTQEEERLRISNALHDSLGQLLYSASLKLQNSSSVNDAFFSQAASLLDQAIKETRRISFELSPSILADYGLAVAVNEMAARINSKTLVIQTRISGLDDRLQLQAETDIYRIVQELVNNIVKHAGATKAVVKINRLGANKVVISVQDNGKGFNPEERGAHGTGLSSIRNRISLYGGTMKITSHPAKGTSVTIKLENVTGN